jgi:hypothetical protein
MLLVAVLPALLIFAIFACRRIGNRPMRTGAHNLAATKRRLTRPSLRQKCGTVADSMDRGATPPDADRSADTDRIVRSHHVLSGRLMDAPTGRLWPSERHRVPPWVTASREASTDTTPSSFVRRPTILTADFFENRSADR